jgi:hypothetical protein
MAIQARARLDASYAALFKSLGLPSEQLDKFKNLLVEKQLAVADVMASAMSQGLNPRDPQNRTAVSEMVDESNREIDDNIRQVLGDQAYSNYKTYEQTLPERNTASQLAQRLSYTNTPLQDYQSDALVKILASNPAGRNDMPSGLANVMNPGRTAPISSQAVDQAQSVLNPAQTAALAQLQQEQQSQQKMGKIVNEMMKTPGSTGAPAPSGSTLPPTAPPAGKPLPNKPRG